MIDTRCRRDNALFDHAMSNRSSAIIGEEMKARSDAIKATLIMSN